jgi:MYXO-CTERM domain-containing protein
MNRFALLAYLPLVFASGTALANGRYPIANQLVVSPADATHLTLRTTFGLVLSEDQGKTFNWVCERAAGFVNNEDPPIEVTGDGSIFVASSQALNISHDGGCVWAQALADLSIVDADVDQSQPKRAVAIASLYANGKTNSGLEETLDNGQTWAALGTSFDGLPATVALAPSVPTRIYASGTSITDLTPLVSTSDDDGNTWQAYTLNVASLTVPFIAAVDPTHPGVVYVRGPTAGGTDVLVVSQDFGVHWQPIFQAKGGLYGFALSPDGKQIAVGGPDDVLSIASSTDFKFTPASTLKPLCLKWSAAGLYACADEANFGFSLGLSVDSGAHFDALFHKPDLKLKVCPSSTPAGLYCPQAWVGQQVVLGVDAGASPPDSGVEPSDASVGGSSSSGGESGITDAGVASAGTNSGAAADKDASVVPVASSNTGKSSSSGCSMKNAPSAPSARWGWLGFGAALAWQRRRRARRLA